VKEERLIINSWGRGGRSKVGEENKERKKDREKERKKEEREGIKEGRIEEGRRRK
jgi:hypothetical protein